MAESDLEYSSTSSEDESSEGVEEDTEIVTDQITPCKGEPFASSDDNGDDHEEDEEGNEDGLTPAALERDSTKQSLSVLGMPFFISLSNKLLFSLDESS